MTLPKTCFSVEKPTPGDNKKRSSLRWLMTCETIPVVALLMICCFFLYYDYLLCNKLYLFKDIGNDSLLVFYPKYVHLSKYLRTYGIPGWSFSIGLGQDAFPYSLGNPFELIIILFPPQLVGYAIIFTECLKSILSGLLVFKAFRISLFSRPVALVGCILYAFSGYMVVGGQWHVFSVEAFHVALLIYAFERYLADRTCRWLIAAFLMVAAFLPFNLYLMCVFLSLYVFMRLWNRRENVVMVYKTVLDILLAFVSGVGLAAIFFLPALSQILQNPRSDSIFRKIIVFLDGGQFRLESAEYYSTLFLRFFSCHLEGLTTGWGNYLEAPLIYIGLPAILLAPLSFAGAGRRYQIGTGIVLFVTSLIILIPSLRFVFWLGTNVYVRFAALMMSSFLLMAALHALERYESWGKKHLVLTAATLVFCTVPLMFFSEMGIKASIEGDVRNVVLSFLVLYAAMIVGGTIFKERTVFMTLLLVVVSAEVVVINSFSVNNRPVVTHIEHNERSGYNDYSVDAIRSIHDTDRGFFRVIKEFSSSSAYNNSLNDGMVQGYNGVSVYQSFNHPNLIRFLNTVGVIDVIDESNSRWINMLNKHPLPLTLLNSKYVLTKNGKSRFLDAGYDRVATSGDIITLKNRFFLPFGYSYKRFMSKKTFEQLGPQEKQMSLMRACFVEEENSLQGILPSYEPHKGDQYTIERLERDVAELSQNSFQVTTFQQELIEGNINLDHPSLVLFSMPFDKGWSAFVDGQRGKLVMANGGLTGIVMITGEHKLKLTYRSPWRTTGAIISLITLLSLVIMRCRATSLKSHKDIPEQF